MIPDFELDNSEVTLSLFDQYEPQVRHIICDVYLKLNVTEIHPMTYGQGQGYHF